MGEGTDDFSSIDLEQQYPRDIESSRHRVSSDYNLFLTIRNFSLSVGSPKGGTHH